MKSRNSLMAAKTSIRSPLLLAAPPNSFLVSRSSMKNSHSNLALPSAGSRRCVSHQACTGEASISRNKPCHKRLSSLGSRSFLHPVWPRAARCTLHGTETFNLMGLQNPARIERGLFYSPPAVARCARRLRLPIIISPHNINGIQRSAIPVCELCSCFLAEATSRPQGKAIFQGEPTLPFPCP